VTRYSDIPKPIRSGIVLIDPERGTSQRIIVLGILFQLRTMRLLFSGPTTTRRRVVLNSTPAQISITPMVDDWVFGHFGGLLDTEDESPVDTTETE
jgi:hypothetical protein